MFRLTNPSIDRKVLAERASLELARLRRAEAERRSFAVMETAESSGDYGEPRSPQEGKMSARKVVSKVSGWLWCFYHLPAVWRTASGAQSQAAAASAQTAEALAQAADALAELDNARAEARELVDNARAEARELVGAISSQVVATSSQVAALRREIMFQQRRLSRLLESRSATSDQLNANSHPRESVASSDPRLDSLYVAFEDIFRGNPEEIKERVTPYLDRLILAGAGQSSKPILDAGCGRGEWLETLKEAGLTAYGVDSNLVMVERSTALGLNVIHSDLVDHLSAVEDESRSAITAFHIVEHLPLSVLVDFLDEALRVLVPGGLLLLETPNPENMRVGATTFYTDPTHRNPILPDTLRFMVEHRGFTEAEIIRLHPAPSSDHLRGDDWNVRHLNNLLFGPRDYSILARRI